jgi:NAD(P)-dependent dehydrogenase (short-subunit alcohol dehydrogenase family)
MSESKFLPLPPSVLPLPEGPEGYRLQRAGERGYVLISGFVQAAFVVTGEGVVLVDAPPALDGKLQAAPRAPLAALDPGELTRQLSLNLLTAAVVTKHALRVMQPVGTGRIVHTASRAATASSGSGFAYSVSKLGVLHLVRMAAEEVAGTGITINSVVPSIIDTPANRAAMPGADYDSWPKVPDIAHAYLFLASPRAALVNGAAVPV